MSDPPSEILVPMQTGTHGDVFAAVGLADLLSDPTCASARIVQAPGGYVVRPCVPLDDGFFATLPVNIGYPFLKTNDKVDVPSRAEDPVSYKDESERVKQYWKLREEAKKAKDAQQDPLADERLKILEPRGDWRLLQALNWLQGDETSNSVHAVICGAGSTERRRWVREGVTALAAGNDWQAPWKAKMVQLFTPTAAKGYARLKPDSTNRGDGTKEQWTRPFSEWLKYRGYFRVACSYSLGDDIRLLCPVPADISARAVVDLARELRRARVSGGPAKVDALAVLDLARLLIEHSTEYHEEGVPPFEGLDLGGRTPADVVSGVMVTHYQSLGSARAVTSMSMLTVPGWFPLGDPERARVWLSILEEHRRIVRGLKDDHSDQIALLLQYRRFLERRATTGLLTLLDFMSAYGQFLIRAREQNPRVPAFTTSNLKEVTMGLRADYGQILEDSGFLALAGAVRQATVTAQYWKSKREEHREIRYDLIPELRRKRTLPNSALFIETVAEFVASYNLENARRREMGKGAPANVTTQEFAAFCHQVQTHGASLLGALLCAYGSCREPRERAVAPAAEGQGMEQAESPADGAETDEVEEE
ncbi:MAG: hypothetical protein ACYC3S_12855 [Chloroflexota bacterium]